MDKKRILFIVPSLTGGGAEKTVVNLSNLLKDKFDITIATFFEDTNPDVNVRVINMWKKPKNSLQKIFGFIKKISELSKIKKEYKFDYSISYLDGPSFYNVLTKKNDKTIVSIRNKMSSQTKTLFLKMRLKYTLKKADKIVSLSKMVKKDLVDNYDVNPSKIITIYNPVNIDTIESKSNIEADDIIKEKVKNKKVIINIGRLCYQKGQWHLINSFKKIHNKYNDTVLLILGVGENEKELKKLVDRLDLSEDVIFAGYVENPYSYISISDIFVFPSIFEGLGNALIEACAVGIPIISTDCKYGPREILAPQTDLNEQSTEVELAQYGILIPPYNDDRNSINKTNEKDKDYLEKAISLLISNPEMFKKYKKQSKVCAKRFDEDKIKKEWLLLLEGEDRNE